MITKKLITSLFFSLFGLIIIVSFNPIKTFAYDYPNGSKAKAGDILISKETNCKPDCKGLTGHAAIVVNSDYFVHIAGPGYNPSKERLSKWFNTRYGKKTKVVRPTSAYKGSAKKAAAWANNYVEKYPNAKYSVWSSSASFNKTYCSKLVWQAFYYGSKGYPIVARKYFDKIHPYDFSIAASGGKYAKLKTVYKNWWLVRR